MQLSAQQAPISPFLKTISVEIDRASWKGRYVFPSEFMQIKVRPQIDFASALLWTGVAALVQSVPRWWSAIRWAQTKYAYSLDDTPDLRLHRGMADLEKHHKSVLSDEWGVGVALEWLTNIFGYDAICHGETAVRQLRRMELLKDYPKKRKKIGPQKCPDFVAVTSDQRLHIIECKGTTQGRSIIKGAFKTAREQKYSIKFKNDAKFVSQRLSVGLAIANNPSAKGTTLYVEDPDELSQLSAGAYFINDDAEPEEIERAVLACVLIERSALAGAFDVLRAASSDRPMEDIPTAGESDLATEMVKFETANSLWIGQEFVALTPVPLFPSHTQTIISIRSGISPELYGTLRTPKVWRDINSRNSDIKWKLKPMKESKLEGSGLRTWIRFGDSFIEELRVSQRQV